jgi:preprotein translocase subunit SecA
VIEGQRQAIHKRRQAVLTGEGPCGSERERLITLRVLDDLWADHLAAVAEYRGGVHWVSWGGREPLHQYLTQVHAWFQELEVVVEGEVARRLEEVEQAGDELRQRGATWTYLTTDQPFGTATERIVRGLLRKVSGA